MKLYSYILILSIFLSSCNSRERKVSEDSLSALQTVVQGKLFAEESNFLLLQRYTPGKTETLDTIVLADDGHFEAAFFQNVSDIYLIRNKNGNGIIFIANPGDTIYIQSSSSDFKYFSLSGKPELKAIENLNLATQQFLITVDTLAIISRDNIHRSDYTEIKLEVDRKYHQALNMLRARSKELIYNNEGSLFGLLALTNKIGAGSYVFNPEKDRKLFLRTDSILYSMFPSTEAVIAFHENVKAILNQPMEKNGSTLLHVGENAPNFSLPSPEGSIVTLDSLEGKYILINFWASWSPACRRQNPILLSAYKKFYDKGFEIIQISLDESKVKWLAAIEEDNLPWLHAADLKGWDSYMVDLYGIKSIPLNYLLDPEGNIIEVNLLEKDINLKLEEILKNE